jgi:lantibiotic modifying enzyme
MANHRGLSEASILSKKAQKSLEESLLLQFVQISGMAIMEVFDRSISTARRTTLKLLGKVAGTAPTENYRAFIQHHLGNGWSELFDDFPVLLHLLTLAITHWVDSSEEFLCRLHKDLPVLGGRKAEMVFPSLSDPHNGRRMVAIVVLDTGRKVVYKPKSLGLEVAFDAFLGWINEQGLVPAFKRLAVVNCDAYGWTEHVDQNPCLDEASAVE